ncbi:MAG: hypothetical protein LBK62_04885 [Treponema sp.]|jgi:alpha-N-arabinofuranosidase|nr:hypothetical protein [Treponema sp.]
MEKKAKITVHPGFRIGTIDPRIYGAFLEPIRNWVYGGIWNPNHETADDMGFRRDVLELVREFENPGALKPLANAATKMENGHVYAAAKRLSWNCVRLGKK